MKNGFQCFCCTRKKVPFSQKFDKAYIVMKKVPCDVIQKQKNVTKKSYIKLFGQLFKAKKYNFKLNVTFLVTFFFFLIDVIGNIFICSVGNFHIMTQKKKNKQNISFLN